MPRAAIWSSTMRPRAAAYGSVGGNATAAGEQPYIHRLVRLGAAAEERGRGLAFADEVSPVIWGGTVEGWNEGAHLADATRRAGLDPDALETAIATAPAAYDAIVEENHRALEAAGHWGVPTFVFAGEPFFGQDRIDLLVWRLRQHGLARRSGAPPACADAATPP